MNRPLTVLFLIGLIGMAMVTVMGSMFVSKVGGAETVLSLREEVVRIFGPRMEDPASLSIVVVLEDGRNGLRVGFRPAASTVGRPAEFMRCLDRIASYLFERQSRRSAADFVLFELPRPDGSVLTHRVERP
jgi:hypothetical protein